MQARGRSRTTGKNACDGTHMCHQIKILWVTGPHGPLRLLFSSIGLSGITPILPPARGSVSSGAGNRRWCQRGSPPGPSSHPRPEASPGEVEEVEGHQDEVGTLLCEIESNQLQCEMRFPALRRSTYIWVKLPSYNCISDS